VGDLRTDCLGSEPGVRVAVAIDSLGWHEHFVDELSVQAGAGDGHQLILVDLHCADWQRSLEGVDLLLWKPAFIGPVSASLFKEKIFFIESHLGILTVPNFASVWHYESKIAQSYLFDLAGIPSPRTVATFSLKDARERLLAETYPLVFKEPFGASSQNVQLAHDRRHALRLVDRAFCQEKWNDLRHGDKQRFRQWLAAAGQSWLWEKIRTRIVAGERFGHVYWQEYIPGNDADLRITVVGDRFAYAFWRLNRPNDFRASGSGRIDYDRPVPLDAVRYCIELSKRHSFDSMAYDLLFRGEDFVICEMSYAYVDKPLHEAPGHFLLQEAGLDFISGHVWPQALWVEWALLRAGVTVARRQQATES